MKPQLALLTHQQFSLLAVSIVTAIGAHLLRMPQYLTILLLSLLVARWFQHRYYPRRISLVFKLPLILLLFLLIFSHYGNLFGREMGSALASAMLVLKLIESEQIRDARMAIAFASFVLMSALLSAQSLGFTFALSSALILFLATLRELQPRSATLLASSHNSLIHNFTQAGKSLLMTLPLAVCFFLFFPRLSAPLWGINGGESIGRTGIGDRMAPGGIAELLLNDSPAFRVAFDNIRPLTKELYWRGPVLTFFDGDAWTLVDSPLVRDDTPLLEIIDNRLSYEITLDPTYQRWLFALDMPTAAPAESMRDSTMVLSVRQPVSQLRRYRASSALNYRLNSVLSPMQRAQTLQLPLYYNSQSRALAAEWRKKYRNDQEIIQAALDLFHASFTYSLQDVLLEGTNKVDNFLFSTQRGYCEHFSSAFVFLMRAAGIPARVVTGYQGGWYSESGNYLLIRQSDAHAWAEVWLPERGWVRVDPTASVSPERIEHGSRAANSAEAPWYQADWLINWRNRFDFINQKWNSLVVQFNAARQANVLQRFGIKHAEYKELVWMLGLCGGAMLLLSGWWALRKPRLKIDPLDAAYGQLCRKLAKAGIERHMSEGPQDFANRVHSTRPDLSRLMGTLLLSYIQLRYASPIPDGAVVENLKQKISALRLSYKQRKFPLNTKTPLSIEKSTE